jgi:hypothetical protein
VFSVTLCVFKRISSMKDTFTLMCEAGLKQALLDKDGWLAHFYSTMLRDSTPILNPRVYTITTKWVD